MNRINPMLVLLFITLIIFTTSIIPINSQGCSVSSRSDCGYLGINQQQCESRGCCWSPASNGEPYCYYQSNQTPIYSIISISQPIITHYSIQLKTNNQQGQYGEQPLLLQCDIVIQADYRINIKFTDPNSNTNNGNNRWEIPESIIKLNKYSGSIDNNNPLISISISSIGQPLSINITRLFDNVLIFQLGSDLQYSDQFLQISNIYPNLFNYIPNIYGIGEHIDSLRLNSNSHSYTLWNSDVPTPEDQNLYGSHPFYIQLYNNGNAHGIYLHNSNGMDIIVNPDRVTYRTIGGILDLYIFTGITPELVTQQYHELIGKPYLPPYWSLGWHQCRYGYKDLNDVQQVVSGYARSQIPLDGVWVDIDYMDAYKDFTFDPVNFPIPHMNNFTSELHSNGMKFITIIDPGIHNENNYGPYQDGLADNIFITESDGKTPFIGAVWPGSTAFPDFTNPNIDSYWGKYMAKFLSTVPIDGIWIDMNEVSNFGNGSPSSNSKYNNPPYSINNFNNRAPLNTKTLPMDSLHYNNIPEYNVHNLYGLTEAQSTHRVLVEIQQVRPFILSRSTFPSSGAYTAHWQGDNYSSFQSMAGSIVSILTSNLFGIPFIGADICGFLEDTTEELCNRWMALGAFYPFSRNHNTIGARLQEPYQWPSVTETAKIVLGARYSLLPHLYTLFYLANQNGGTVARPLFFEFPTDRETWGIQAQYLLGNSILISPVLTQGSTSVVAYFSPQALWYEYWTGYLQTATGYQTLQSPINHIQVHIRAGIIIPNQYPALTTAATRSNQFFLIVALDSNSSASGTLFWDDGLELSVGNNSLLVSYTATAGLLQSTIVNNNSTQSIPTMGQIKLWGVQSIKSTITVQGQSYNSYWWDSVNHLLTINGLTLDMTQPITITW